MTRDPKERSNNMDKEMEIEVFRVGDYGEKGQWAEADLDRMAQDYAPDRHEAPVTVDHHQDGPALGWVKGLRRMGNRLLARLGGLEPAFTEMLESGRFKKRSVELYRRLESTGRPYLKAVSFLGAASPAVKGMEDPVFTEDGKAEAACFTETLDEELPEEKSREEAAAFCEQLRVEGRWLPQWERMGLEPFLESLEREAPLFEEGPPARQWFLDFLRSLAPLVPGQEMPSDPKPSFHENPGMPDNRRGVALDDRSIQLHRLVCQYQEKYPETSYTDALRRVSMA